MPSYYCELSIEVVRGRVRVKHGQVGKQSETTAGANFAALVDGVIQSRFFWSYCLMVNILSSFLTSLASWCEGCHCHQDDLLASSTWYTRSKDCRSDGTSCCYKGRRAPELATGHLDQHLEALATSGMTDVLGFCDGLDAIEQGALLSDWHAAVDKCIFELTLKTAHWQMLPWCLAAVGHPDPDIARAFLRKPWQVPQDWSSPCWFKL